MVVVAVLRLKLQKDLVTWVEAEELKDRAYWNVRWDESW